MRRIGVWSLLVLISGAPAFAQTPSTARMVPNVSFSPKIASKQAAAPAQRGGFTILVNLGLGIQNDEALDESATGVAGINLGVGGFLKPDLALLFRISGTNVRYDVGPFELNQVSGVVGGTLQVLALRSLHVGRRRRGGVLEGTR